jgi:hypothetical protein
MEQFELNSWQLIWFISRTGLSTQGEIKNTGTNGISATT